MGDIVSDHEMKDKKEAKLPETDPHLAQMNSMVLFMTWAGVPSNPLSRPFALSSSMILSITDREKPTMMSKHKHHHIAKKKRNSQSVIPTNKYNNDDKGVNKVQKQYKGSNLEQGISQIDDSCR